MKTPRRPLFLALILLLAGISACSFLNSFQSEGTLVLPGLKAPVTVHRDEKGMAFVYAQDLHDAVMAQGFVTAQDRLFQMELTRLFATGRICELAGEEARPLAIRMKTIGFLRNAKKHAALLEPETRAFFQKYLDGVNAFIRLRPKEHHLEFKLAGIKPTPWTIEDSLAVFYLMSWNSAANLDTEIIAQMLVDKLGLEKAKEIFPLNLNPDETPGPEVRTATQAWTPLGLEKDQDLLAYLKDRTLGLGSNNWSVGSRLSAGGKPIVANDPHLDARTVTRPMVSDRPHHPPVSCGGRKYSRPSGDRGGKDKPCRIRPDQCLRRHPGSLRGDRGSQRSRSVHGGGQVFALCRHRGKHSNKRQNRPAGVSRRKGEGPADPQGAGHLQRAPGSQDSESRDPQVCTI